MEVACLAKPEGRTPLLGVLYDELVRKTWEQRSHSRHSFKVVDVIGTLDENTLRNARILHDTFLGAPGKDTVAKASVAIMLVKNRLPYIA